MERRTFIGAALASAGAAALPKIAFANDVHGVLASLGIAEGSHTDTSHTESFYPSVTGLPALPAINWAGIGATAPTQLTNKTNSLGPVDVVVICWAEAEWAAIEHVFCSSSSSMAYSKASESTWTGWQKYTYKLDSAPSSDDWTYWGYYTNVEVIGKKVLLFKSNTHLDWPGSTYLADLINLIIKYAKPSLIMSTGTAGGSRLNDYLGTINVVNAATMYETSGAQSTWPNYTNSFSPPWSVIEQSGFNSLLVKIPVTSTNLQTIATQFNKYYSSSYSLTQLDAGGLCLPTTLPALNNLTTSGTPLLTASTFVTGNNSGDYANFAVIEMDDAVIAETCAASNVPFCFVRQRIRPGAERCAASFHPGQLGQRGVRRVRVLHQLQRCLGRLGDHLGNGRGLRRGGLRQCLIEHEAAGGQMSAR